MRFGERLVGSLGWTIDHAATRRVRAQTRLDVVPVLDGAISFEPKHLEADAPCGEVVLGVSEHEVAIGEQAHHVHPRVALGDSREEIGQPFAALGSLGVVLDVPVLVDHRYPGGISGLDALEELVNQGLALFAADHVAVL
jgi:hypothetical protein